jgi:hypothetical protein
MKGQGGPNIQPAAEIAGRKRNTNIVGAFCFPHGAITLDPETRNFSNVEAAQPDSKEKCIRLHHAMAMRAQARALVSTKPDLIILSTPHGLKVQKSYLFLSNNKVSI